MKKTMIAGACLLLGGALVAPAVMSSAAEDSSQLAQAGPERSGMQPTDRMGGPMGGREGHHGWMRQMMQMPPQQRCEERLARRAGIVAYLVAKLNFNDQQRPLWDKLNAVLQTNAGRERQLCTTLKPADQRGQETMLDRINRREQFLSARLQGLQQAKPALEQLYNSLTPEQKAIADHPFRH
ncbi:MAG TPA: Spy/CpxP family protein refolding chaperone [Stellaceae bacterium]|nr:Spy/CpxP family protein refolding chaperone [Stellaceae bacterium]